MRWFRNGEPVPGQTALQLVLPNAQPADAGRYHVEVTGEYGTGISEPVDIAARGTPRVLAGGSVVAVERVFHPLESVVLDTSFPGGRIFFTLDGTEPTADSPEYQSPITLTNDAVVRAFALSSGLDKTATNAPVRLIRGARLSLQWTGEGHVTGAGDGVYKPGESVSLRAIPRRGWRFAGWQDGVEGTGPTVSILMTNDLSVTAVFEPLDGLVVNLASEGEGHIEVSPDRSTHLPGDTVYLKAVAAGGWRLLRWEGDASGRDLVTRLTMDQDKSVRAVFEPIPKFPITIDALAETGTATGAGEYLDGTEIEIRAVPKPGWRFLGWSGDYSGLEESFRWTVTGPATFTPRFGTTIQVSSTGAGSLVLEPDLPVYEYGTRVKVIPKPNDGQYLSVWTDAGLAQPKTGWTLIVTNPEPKIGALFSPLTAGTAALQVSTMGGGDVTGNPPKMAFTIGESVTLTAEPWPDFVFAGWGGAASGRSPSVTLTVGESQTVTATFVQDAENRNPQFVAVDTQVVAEGELLRLTLTATDPDLPAQSLVFRLDSGPAGLSVSPEGVLSWTPTEAQGPSTNAVVVRVTDDGTPPLEAVQPFEVIVREVNSPPVLAELPLLTARENEPLRQALAAYDADIPAQRLEYSLVSGPQGLTVSPAGFLDWTPQESQGGAVYPVTVRVSDDGVPALSTTALIQILVPNDNHPPRFTAVAPQTVVEGELLSLILEAVDSDVPAQGLAFRLISGPAGMTVDAGGHLRWIPTASQSPGSYQVIVGVVDDGIPATSAETRFSVEVSKAPDLTLRRVWQIGTDDDPGVAPYQPSGEFSTENGRNDPAPGAVTRLPGDPQYDPDANPSADDDFYFLGVYPAGFNGLTERLEVPADEPSSAWEMAQTTQDRTNRLHFVLEAEHVRTNATFRLTMEFPKGGSATGGIVAPEFGTHPITIRFRNGEGVETELATAIVSQPTNLVLNFSAEAVQATAGGNSLEITRTDPAPAETVRWLIYDFLRLESFPPGGAPPVITRRPTGATIGFGESVALTVAADSAEPPAYQWFRNKKPIPGATNATHVIASMGVGDVGDYLVEVSNASGTVSSFPDNDVRVMLRGAFVIEAEDFNFGGGETLPEASVMPLASDVFQGRDGLPGIDFFLVEDNADSACCGNQLRNGWIRDGEVVTAPPGGNVDVIEDNLNGNAVRPDFVLEHNYKLGWGSPGEWYQYTRTFVPGRYSAVFIGAREGRAPDAMGRTLELVLDAPSVPNPATELLGELLAEGTGGWGSHDWIPFQTPGGEGETVAVAEFDLGGTQTLRLRHHIGDGDDDAILLYRLPSSTNLPPVFAAPGDIELDEGQSLSLILSASDPDGSPANLVYHLEQGPPGLEISPAGQVTWTPTEAQAPASETVTVSVTDSGTPPLSATTSWVIRVREVNQAPVFPPPADPTVIEGELFEMLLTAVDEDLPVQELTYRLVSGPPGLELQPAGRLVWTPTEAQGPAQHRVTVSVTDNGVPELSAIASFTISVLESNRNPVLNLPAEIVLDEGQGVLLPLQATDPDIPSQSLSFELLEGPAGLTVDSGGLLSWSPTEAQGPSTNRIAIRVTDSGFPPLSTSGELVAIVREINTPPVMETPPDETLIEGQTYSRALSASDGDLPAQGLSYSVVEGPLGMSVNASGLVQWTPGEFQGPSTNLIVLRVSDDGSPSLASTVRFYLNVLESNQPPVLIGISNRITDEEQSLRFSLDARDPDQPPQRLSLSLVEAPPGMTLNPLGEVEWTPTELQGPSTNRVGVRVTDDGEPPLSVTNFFEVVVREVNIAPVLAAVPDQTLEPGQSLSLVLVGEDSDRPPQVLQFSLVNGPLGLNVEPEGGIHWSPTPAQTPSTNTVIVRLSDDGDPSLAATAEFRVIVRSPEQTPDLRLVTSSAGEPLVLEIRANEGQALSLESAGNLAEWTQVQSLSGLGKDTPIRVFLPASGNEAVSFWRVRTVP
ncbi:MAG: chitobiase/beta-hexosaminidase C-terminal domain-containing protein [Verrucomicrobiae bacterium]|nr:chitobiase/beta-hexosaminidase C-terminal domain-containing protein [Verrucomicrobiae bacterium]